MRSCRSARVSPACTATALVVAMCLGGSLHAQSATRLSGRVIDSTTGAALIGAEIRLVGTPVHAYSDERGAFSLVSSGGVAAPLEIRRLGYRPTRISVSSTDRPLEIRLATAGHLLAPLQIRAARTRYEGRLAGYYSRLERHPFGQFITHEDLEREQPAQLTDMLQRQPGITLTRGRPGAQGVRMRGRNCRPLIWLDGSAMTAGDVDLDSFAPGSLEGIELYLGSSVPGVFQAARGQSDCGTIALWTRESEPERQRRLHYVTPDELESLLATDSVYAADDVDTRATLDPERGWQVPYPPSLRASRTGGQVIAEFVVDTTGMVDEAHVGIVASTDPLLSAAVRESSGTARFSPATRRGKKVRQLVRLPFDFTPGTPP